MSSENVFDAEQMALEFDTQQREITRINRLLCYQKTADPLFFEWQAGTASKEEWLTAREEVRKQYPYSEEVSG